MAGTCHSEHARALRPEPAARVHMHRRMHMHVYCAPATRTCTCTRNMQDALRLHMRVCVYGGTAASDLSPLSKSWRGSCSAVRSRLGTVATAGAPHTHGLPARMTSRRASSRSALEVP